MFKSIERREFVASNGNTVRFDIGPDGSVKIAARKGEHNQSVSVLGPDAIASLIDWLGNPGV